jgi:hypothetical protein
MLLRIAYWLRFGVVYQMGDSSVGGILARGVTCRIQDILRGVGTCVVRQGGRGTSRTSEYRCVSFNSSQLNSIQFSQFNIIHHVKQCAYLLVCLNNF